MHPNLYTSNICIGCYGNISPDGFLNLAKKNKSYVHKSINVWALALSFTDN